MAKKGEGTFSEVLKAQCIKNGKYVAVKCMKNHFDSLDQVNNLREIQALRRLSPHGNVIKLLEVLYDQPTGRLALVFELMDMNIYELIRGRRHYVAEDRVKTYVYQLVKSMDHMHRNGIFHRDIKPENILIMDDCLKLADFGSCRGIYSKQPYTEYISTRWYRAPECLLTDGYYNYKMDMWGVGCVFFEMVALFPLFPGTNELDQIHKIHNIIGTPRPEFLAKMKQRSQHMDFNFAPKTGSGIEKLVPHCAPECVDLMTKLLAYDPDDRLSARQALRHPYFCDIREAEKRRHAMLRPKNEKVIDSNASSRDEHVSNKSSPRGSHENSNALKNANDDVSSRFGVPTRAPAPSVASSGVASVSVADSNARRRAGRGVVGDDLPTVGGQRSHARAPPPSSTHASSVASGHHRTGGSHHERSSYHAGAASSVSSVSGASVLSAGGISLGGSQLGLGGSRFKSAAVPSGGMRGGVVGKPYGGVSSGANRDRLSQPAQNAPAVTGVGGTRIERAHASKPRSGDAREKYVSPYGQRR